MGMLVMQSYDSYFMRLSAATGGEIKGPTLSGLKELFGRYDDDVIDAAVSNAEDTPSIPRNLFGFVKQLLRGAALDADRATIQSEHWTAKNDDCLSSKEWQWGFACISIMLKLSKEYGKDYASMNKYFSDGFNKAIAINSSNNCVLHDYLKKFYATMKQVQSESQSIREVA